jgi:oligopeptide transport system permease protein
MEFLKAFAKRVAWTVLTLWAVYTLTFLLMRFSPGGPFASEKNMPEAIKRNVEARYHLNDPLLKQYADNLGRIVFHGDFGPSMKLEDYTVWEVIGPGFSVSAPLGILALMLALMFGLLAGLVAASRRNTLWDSLTMGVATIGIALPSFVTGSLAIVLFVFWLGWLPAGGWGSAQQILLPAVCLALPYAAYIARLTKASALETLGQDYIRTAYAKGLPERQVLLRHALRGAIQPVISYLAPATAAVLTGSLVIERIFAIPGMGTHFIEAATQRDYPLVTGIVLLYTLLLNVMNLLVDVARAVNDPRVRLE